MRVNLKFRWLTLIVCVLLLFVLIWSVFFHPTITYTYILSNPAKHHVNSDWENYVAKYDENAHYNLVDFNRNEIIDILGKPLYTLQKETKSIVKIKKEEMLIYKPFVGEGTTAIYLDIFNGDVTDYRVDDCLGIDPEMLPQLF